MPSAAHETLIELFRDQPALGPAVLQAATRIALPPGARARAAEAQFSDLSLPEYHADLVLRIEGSDGRLLHLLVIEAQLEPNADKRFSWPLYVVGQRARLRCPVTLMIVTLTRTMARWCARRIPLDLVGNGFEPLVIGPEAIPRVTDPADGRAFPALAVLSAVAHGKEPGAEHIATAAFAGCDTLDRDRGALYADFIHAHLSQTAQLALEALMLLEGYEYQSDFAKKYVQQGREDGLRTILARLLEQRFGALPATAQAALDQADTDQLLRWGERVLTAASLDDLFAQP